MKLMKRSDTLKTSCQSRLNQIEQESKALQKQKMQTSESLVALQKMYSARRLDGQQVNRKDIYEHVRKLAVIEHNIGLIELELSKINDELASLTRRRVEETATIKALWLRQKKYEYLIGKIHEVRMEVELQQDEEEQEERYSGDLQ